MDASWFINASILLKGRLLVELVKGVVLWCIWLYFQDTSTPTLQVVGTRIISLCTSWCNNLNNGSLI